MANGQAKAEIGHHHVVYYKFDHKEPTASTPTHTHALKTENYKKTKR